MKQFDFTYLDKDFLDRPINVRHNFENKGNNIFYGKILNDKFCDFIMDIVQEYEVNENTGTANSMHRSAIPIKELYLDNLIQLFVDKILVQIIYSIFPEKKDQLFDSIHSYIVRYSEDTDINLGVHVDDSAVTMNLCLNEQFIGSDLIFTGVRCPIHVDTPCSDSEDIFIKHKKDFMTLHNGKNRHYVNSINEGKRYGLIIWCQSSNEKSQWFNALETSECLDFCNYCK